MSTIKRWMAATVFLSCVLTLFMNFVAIRIFTEPECFSKALNFQPNRSHVLLTINHELGRLGNRMFKYASLLGLAKTLRRHAFVLPYKTEVNLETVFELTHVEKRCEAEVMKWPELSEKSYATHDPYLSNPPRKQHARVDGYVQSFKYFEGIEDEIRREFTFRPHIQYQVEGIKAKILQKYAQGSKDNINVVGVHVRREDVVSNDFVIPIPRSYYFNAIAKMRSLIPDGKRPLFLVASNDLEWCRDNLLTAARDTDSNSSNKNKNTYNFNDDVVVLDFEPPEIHFAVLASSDHVILSVGSFGWWAGWLSRGHVIYYKKFPLKWSWESIGFTHEDYYPPDWIAVDD